MPDVKHTDRPTWNRKVLRSLRQASERARLDAVRHHRVAAANGGYTVVDSGEGPPLMRSQDKGIVDQISSFLGTAPKYSEFPLGGLASIPSAGEVALLSSLMQVGITSEEAAMVRSRVTYRQSYDLMVFGLRMSTYAVRTKSPPTLTASTYLLALANDRVDPRDVLAGISIVEDCALRLRIDPDSVFAGACAVVTPVRRATIEMDYLSREPQWRGLSVMGMEAIGSDDLISYRRKI